MLDGHDNIGLSFIAGKGGMNCQCVLSWLSLIPKNDYHLPAKSNQLHITCHCVVLPFLLIIINVLMKTHKNCPISSPTS